MRNVDRPESGERVKYFKILWNFQFWRVLFPSPHITLKFQICCERDLTLQKGGGMSEPETTSQGRHTSSTNQPNWLHIWHSEYWSCEGKWVQCLVCPIKRERETKIKLKCEEYSVVLYADSCFMLYHTKLHFWTLPNTTLETAANINLSYC
jgi:hypothetical protein